MRLQRVFADIEPLKGGYEDAFYIQMIKIFAGTGGGKPKIGIKKQSHS